MPLVRPAVSDDVVSIRDLTCGRLTADDATERCPVCGAEMFRPVPDGTARAFRCEVCGAGWHRVLGFVIAL
jgi:formate dehydrogenase maturation protein FdhE